MVGDPTGLSLKKWMGKVNAIDMGLAWSMRDDGYLQVHADYLWHKYDLFEVPKGKLPLYYGIGAVTKLADDFRLGLRIPVGLDYIFANNKFDFFLEIVPVLDLVPSTDLDWNAAAGFRYYIK
jgi:hypothetical protein